MEQNYSNHAKLVTGYHRVLPALLLAGMIGAFVNLYQSFDTSNLYSASLILLLFVCCVLLFWYVRVFPLKAQDRAIRAEENFRHFILTGKPLPQELKIHQVVALRFASDEELPELARRAADSGMNSKDIKQAIRNWKADHNRV